MKKFLLVLLAVLAAIGVLAACAPLEEGLDYARALPGWAIVLGAIVVFFIGFGIIWKLIPGFIKFLALIALIVIVAGTAYGLWQIPLVSKAIDGAEEFKQEYLIDDGDAQEATQQEAESSAS